MAWIKIDKDMLDDGRLISAAARRMKHAPEGTTFGDLRNAVTGALLRLWIHADTHIRDDDVLELTPDAVDSLLDFPGFCTLMPADWLEINDEGFVRLPGYAEKNGIKSRDLRRKQTRDRVQRYRKRKGNADVTPLHGAQDQDQDHKKKSPKPPFDFSTIPNLDPGAWAAWQHYRKAEGFRKYKSTQVATALAKYSPAVQRAAVQQAIEAGWQGLQPQKVERETRGRHGANSFDEHTRRLAEWYLEQTGNVLPGNA